MKPRKNPQNCQMRAHESIHDTRYTIHDTRGFPLLLAALISSVVLSLGISVFDIARKQIILSSIGRESQFAFYAADTGLECALYWDIRWNYFSTTTPTDVVSPQPQCATKPLNASGRPSPPAPNTYAMDFQFEPNGKCAIVKVEKCATGCDDSPNVHTVISSDGYNTACASIPTSLRVLQRSVELRY